jgi:hypothetical protein
VILSVQMATADSDEYDGDTQARLLRNELLSLDLDDVTLDRPAVHEQGSKGGAITTDTLIMTTANSAVLVAACQVIRSWVTRANGRSATLRYGGRRGQSLKITGSSAAQHQELIDAFVAAVRHDLEEATGRDD